MTVAKRTRQIFGETKQQTYEKWKKNEIVNYASLTIRTLSEMTTDITHLLIHSYTLRTAFEGQPKNPDSHT